MSYHYKRLFLINTVTEWLLRPRHQTPFCSYLFCCWSMTWRLVFGLPGSALLVNLLLQSSQSELFWRHCTQPFLSCFTSFAGGSPYTVFICCLTGLLSHWSAPWWPPGGLCPTYEPKLLNVLDPTARHSVIRLSLSLYMNWFIIYHGWHPSGVMECLWCPRSPFAYADFHRHCMSPGD